MNTKFLNKLTFLYIIIPTIIFLIGWCKLYLSIPISIALIIIYLKRYKLEKNEVKEIVKSIKKNKKKILIVLGIILFYVFISGIGGYVYQNDDHAYRNGIFETLVNNKWPVVYDKLPTFKGQIMLVYYFAFWLPAAVIGKIFGLTTGYFFLYLWAVIGVSIVFAYLMKYFKKNYLIPILIFVTFSGLDILENFFHGRDALALINSTAHLEWITNSQMSSFTTQLFWVFNQAIPAWLLTFCILNEEDNRILGVLLALSLIFCTLPAVGLIFVAFYKVFFTDVNILKLIKVKDKFIKWLKNIFTWENILVGIPLLLICALFVKSNIAGSNISYVFKGFEILNILISIIFEVLIYYIVIYKYQNKSPLYYISLISLIICPLLSINGKGDFCMRASIPGLIMLLILIFQSLEKAMEKNDKTFIKILATLLIIGSLTPINEVKRTIANTHKNTVLERYDLVISPCKNNFFGYTKDNLFYKYIARK